MSEIIQLSNVRIGEIAKETLEQIKKTDSKTVLINAQELCSMLDEILKYRMKEITLYSQINQVVRNSPIGNS